ncbi:MAG: hypothetical protein KGJ09_05045 [Candidatus Omnitrophica bacterium]|nr:hypothetical protein [Candidatus Omnitrophota bacterium]
MYRKFSISVLAVCFFLSSVNLSLAAQAMDVAPVVPAPVAAPADDIQSLNEQMLELDRRNRDEEIAIQQLIDQNDELAKAAMARRQNEKLAAIDQTMIGYRNALYARDRARIAANSENPSRYNELIALTQDMDNLTVHHDLEDKSSLLIEKYQMLEILKDEMARMNKKLSLQEGAPNQDQQNKIQMLVRKLGEMDRQISRLDALLAVKDRLIEQKQQQVDLLKSELEKRITQENLGQTPPDNSAALAAKEGQIARLNQMIRQQKDRIAMLEQHANAPVSISTGGITALAPIVVNDAQERWRLPEAGQATPDNSAVLAAKDRLIRDKQRQVDLLKSELENVLAQDNRGQTPLQAAQTEDRITDLKNKILSQAADLKAKDGTIHWLKKVLGVAENKAEYYRLTSQQDQEARRSAAAGVEERFKLVRQLIALQQQQASLLEEKSTLEQEQTAAFDRRFKVFENKIMALLASHRVMALDWETRMQGLQEILKQKQTQVASLKADLEGKIAQEKNQGLLVEQVQDLTARLKDKEAQIAAMQAQLQQGAAAGLEADTLKQQLASAQDAADQLKGQLDAKTAESDHMAMLMADYRKKLESSNNAFNQQLKQVLVLNNYKAEMEKEIEALNLRLQQKEARVAQVKQQMYDLQNAMNAKDMNIQAKDLSMAMVEHKRMNDKINEYQDKIDQLQATNVRELKEISQLRGELDMVRQKTGGQASSDELDFLRAGLKKATGELDQKNQMLAEIKAHAAEYEKDFEEQSAGFQTLKAQLQEALLEIHHKNEDLKYDGMAIARLKSVLDKADKSKAGRLQEQLMNAEQNIRDLQAQVDRLESSSRNDVAVRKMEQAVNKIDEQGRIINLLTRRLQACGQNVNLTKEIRE